MKEAAESAAPPATLASALLDYFAAPGKYQLTLRQPALLFSSVREILQLAAGRSGAGGEDARLSEAARFFVRAALLYPGADHYAVLGLAPGEAPADLKERYRLLMRLTHPDFIRGDVAVWPADAAVRVNRAYETLSSPVQRREYDDQLAALRSQRPPLPKAPGVPPASVPRRAEPRSGKMAAWIFGLAVGVPAILLLMPRSEPGHLVQRASPGTEPAPQRATARATPSAIPAERAPAAESPLATAPEPAAAPAIAAAPASPASPTIIASAPPPTPMPAARAPAVAPTSAPVPAAPAPVARAPAPASVPAAPPPAARPPAVASPPVARTPAADPPPAPRPAAPVVVAAAPPSRPGPLPSAPAVHIAPAAAEAPAPVQPPPPAITHVAVPSAPSGKLTTTLAMFPPPTLADAQPLLTQVLQVLESGSGEQLLRLLDTDARRQPAAQALSRQYEQLVRGSRTVTLSQVEFKGEPREGGILLVTGRIRLHPGEPTIGNAGQRLVLRAEFAQRGGQVLLTGLSGGASE